jgi:ribosomal protein L7/L12
MNDKEIEKRLDEIEKRIENTEIKLKFLFRNLGLDFSDNIPKTDIPEQIKKLLIAGNTNQAIKEFKEITGASLKDAKSQIDKWSQDLK